MRSRELTICQDKVWNLQKSLLGDKPAALKEGIIVAAKANQKPPAMRVNRGTNEQEML